MKDNLVIEEFKSKINIPQIIEFEKTINATLPTSYRDFLLKYNGGHSVQDCFDFQDADAINGQIGGDIAWFLALYAGENINLVKDYDMLKNRIPNELVPIGEDSGGGVICLGVREGKRYGRVYFWDHNWEAEEGEVPDYSNVYLIADSFTSFINSLYKGDVEIDDKGKTIKLISTHDKYSLLYSNEMKGKNAPLITEFFNQAPKEVEEYIIEEIEATKDKVLKYEVKSQGKRFIRTIRSDNSFIDSREQL